MPTTFPRIISALFALVTLTLYAVNIQAAQFEYKLHNSLQTDSGTPRLVIRTTEAMKQVQVTLERADGHAQRAKLGNMKAGETKEVEIRQPKGKHSYVARIEAKTSANDAVNEALTFEVTWVDPIEISINPLQVRIGEGLLPFQSNRPLEKVELEIFDANNQKLADHTQQFQGNEGNLTLNWRALDDVATIRMTAHDVDGFWTALVLEPFWVEIPHQEIVFHFGKATWDDAETPKLQDTLNSVRKAIAEHASKGLQMQLYIAGYTDTVGPAESNLRLSASRAQAIGRWFRAQGLDIPVYYQGFGEKVLAIPTPDETPEPRNRRALYILGNSPPPPSKDIPASNWQVVR